MKNTLILIAFACFYNLSFSQEVISSNGESHTNSAGTLDYTIGETVIETVSAPSDVLTQGMHQPKLNINSINENQLNVNVFPNPTTEFITVSLSELNDGMNYQLFDINGKLIISKPIVDKSFTVDFKNHSSGQYILKILNAQSSTSSFKIQKLN